MNLSSALPLSCAIVSLSTGLVSAQSPQEPPNGRFWLRLQGLESWQWDVDSDGDRMSNRQEYFAGTDPFDPRSFLEADLSAIPDGSFLFSWVAQPATRFNFLDSQDLVDWGIAMGPISADGGLEEIGIETMLPTDFFSVEPLVPFDTDGDGLSDREEAILGTDPEDDNTDGDNFGDGQEVFSTFTDPLVFDPSAGTIRGTVRRVAELTAAPASGTPTEGRTVFLDRNFNTVLDATEPRVATAADGTFEFSSLRPGIYEVRQVLAQGDTQTQPADVTPELPDRLADEVLDYTHAAGGALPEAYGYRPLAVWPGAEQFVTLASRIEPTSPDVLLEPFRLRTNFPPIGSYPPAHFLSLPDGASVTVRFDETIIDGPGPDFILNMPVQGGGNTNGEPFDIAMGPDETSLTTVDNVTLLGATALQFNEIDLADYPDIPFVRVIRILSHTPAGPGQGGTDRGYGLGGFQALNFLPLATSARRVEILGSETVDGQDFASYFQDLPPAALLSLTGQTAMAGTPFSLRLIGTDDLGVASLVLTANGQVLALDAQGNTTFTPPFPGELLVTGTVTDTGGQSVTEEWTLFVADENGVLPFDPEILAEQQGVGTTRVQIFTPPGGDVPTADTAVIASIIAQAGETPDWALSYARFDAIDPADLSASDPDYVEIGSGSGNVYSNTLGTFPASSLADGIYLLRVVAQPQGGGDAVFIGQIVGVGVDPGSLRPQITFTSPQDGDTAALVQEIRGSIASTRPIVSWKVEYAPREAINLANVGGANSAWREIAAGTGTVDNGLFGTLDTSLLTNDSYLIRITAFNDLRLGRVEALTLEVSSEAKLGRNRREFTELSLELAGFPLEVKRVYDSLEKDRGGDFGFGWSFALGDPRLVETVPDTGNNLFGATAYRQGTRLYLDAPDGKRLAFTFQAEVAAQSLIGTLYRATFVPDPGNPYTLKVPEGDDGFLSLRSDGEIRLNFIGLPWNPDRFILTSISGEKYTYDQRTGLLAIEDPNGNRLDFTAVGITHSSGPALTFTRDTAGRITTMTGPGDMTWTYAYAPAGDLISVTDHAGSVTTFGYSAMSPHFLTSVTDPFGRTGVQFEYDGDGRLEAVIDEDGHRQEQSWDPAARTGSITDRKGNTSQLLYDDRGNLLQVTNPLGNVTTYRYDDPRHPDIETTIETENTRIRYVLNAMGLPVETRYGDSFFANLRAEYNDRGQVIKRDLFGGTTEANRYDPKGNLTARVSPLFPNTFFDEYTYTSEGQAATASQGGYPLEFTYDPATGLKKEERGPLGFKRNFTYEPDGRIATVSDATGASAIYTYDDAAHRTTITLPTGGTEILQETATGQLERTDPNSNTSVIDLSTFQLEVKRTLEDGQVVDRSYDEEDNLTAISVPGGHTNTYSHDAMNRQTSFTDAAGQTATTQYDAEGRIVTLINRNGKKRTFGYTSFGFPAFERWHAADDSIEREFTYSYIGTAKLTQVSDGSSTWAILSNTSVEHPYQVTYNYPGQGAFSLSYSWQSYREEPTPFRIQLDSPQAQFFEAELRATMVNNRIYGVAFDAPDGSSDASIRYFYDNMGRINRYERMNFFFSTATVPPVSQTLIERDAMGQMTRIRHENPDGSLSFPEADITYTRDPRGRILTKSQPGKLSTYTYDVRDQLTAALGDETFAYDAAGNPAGATIGADNRLESWSDLTFTYDLEGNVSTQTNTTTGEIRTFSYDHRNQLVQVTRQADAMAAAAVICEYGYDYERRVMFRVEAGVKTWILYDRLRPVAEFIDGTLTFSKIFIYNLDDPAGTRATHAVWTPATGTRWALTDQIGTVNGMLERDGTPVAWVDYSSYGTPLAAVPPDFGPLRFAGRHFHFDAQLYENRLRHYNPTIRRFQQQDPIQYDSGEYNLYRYAENNPLSKSDPLGTSAALEYAVLVYSIGACVQSVYAVADCVNELLGGAAEAVSGKGGCIEYSCVSSAAGIGTNCVGFGAPPKGGGGTGAAGAGGAAAGFVLSKLFPSPPKVCPE